MESRKDWRWGEVLRETTPTIHTLSQSEVPRATTPAASLSEFPRETTIAPTLSRTVHASGCKADDEGIAPHRKDIYEKDAPCEVAPDWPWGETTVRAPRQISAKHHPHKCNKHNGGGG